MPSRPVYILAAGGIGANACAMERIPTDSVMPTTADAPPISLKPLLKTLTSKVPRVASRFAELAVIGARLCLRTLDSPLDHDARLYLATGLGDIARTDALYYQVMPPSSEVASPAHFATSGNNMAAFFVAQQAGLRSRNITLSADALSFEAALDLALADLAHDACASALIGGVDETTVPREFYTRRFALENSQHIGEGSGWIVLGTRAQHAIGEMLGVRMLSMPRNESSAVAIARVARELVGSAESATLLGGCRMQSDELDRIAAAASFMRAPAYLATTGIFPTAIALAVTSELLRPRAKSSTFVHVNRDDALGRIALLAFRAHANAS